MSLKIEYYSQIDIGLKRQTNQDFLLINKEKNIFFLADGLGGHIGGETASSLALESANRYFDENFQSFSEKNNLSPQDFLKQSIEHANIEVFKQGSKHPSLKGMGTTFIALWIYKSKVYIGHVGDSRTYLFQNHHMWQLTEDHVLYKEEIKKGFKNQNSIKNSPPRNALTQGVGITNQIHPDILVRDINPEDIYLMCSDGLHGQVSDSEILKIFQEEDLKNIHRKCIIKALSLGGLDNIAVIVLKVTSQ